MDSYNRRQAARVEHSADIPHGTERGYAHHRCRCDDCKAAKAVMRAADAEWARAGPLLTQGIKRRSIQVLPEDFAAVLREMRAGGDPRLDATLDLARRSGWTLRALSAPLGITHEAVRVRLLKSFPIYPSERLPPIPSPPRPVTRPAKARPRLTINDELAERLRGLHRVAKTVTGGTPVDSPKRRASEELSSILAQLVEQGVTTYHLAQVLGVTASGIGARLGAHGYRKQPPSMARYQYRNVQTSEVRQRPGPHSDPPREPE